MIIMNKKAVLAFLGIYLFLFVLNYLHPMSFGDDYLYSFVWQGKAMFIPLPEDAARLSSWHDLFVSQWSHYLTWSGRTVAHVLAQFFLWAGKDIFNIFNALAGVVLVAEIYWCMNKGHVSLVFDAGAVCWVFFVLWAFTPGFSPVFLWLTAACNYLWTNIILLGFLLPYIKKYYSFYKKNEKADIFAGMMFLSGVLAGWTNENSVCWVILILITFLYVFRKRKGLEKWMYTGLIGLLIGYGLLMFAPGNMERFRAEHGTEWTLLKSLPENINMFIMVFFFQLLLWYYIFRSVYSLKQKGLIKSIIKKEIIFVEVLCISAFGMSATMLFSPIYPPRSSFPGTVLLIIAAGILLRIQKEFGIILMQENARKFLFCVGIVYFAMTSTVTLYHFYNFHAYIQDFNAFVLQHKDSGGDIISVKPLPNSERKAEIMSGYHIPGFELSEDENSWINVAFARYYGIKGIRVLKENKEEAINSD